MNDRPDNDWDINPLSTDGFEFVEFTAPTRDGSTHPTLACSCTVAARAALRAGSFRSGARVAFVVQVASPH